MMGNPILGVFFHWLGGLASGSFLCPVPRRAPLVVGNLLACGRHVQLADRALGFRDRSERTIFSASSPPRPARTWELCYLFGFLWGFGGLTFGLTMRYLGLSLGMAIVWA